MPNLESVLKKTLLLTVDPLAQEARRAAGTIAEFDKAPGTIRITGDKDTQRIWSFKLTTPTADKGPRVTNLICMCRDFQFRPHLVAESIDWGPVKVFMERPVGGKVEQELPLTAPFIVRHFNSIQGQLDSTRAASQKLWKIETHTDVSFQTVFGYLWYPDGVPGAETARPDVLAFPSGFDFGAADLLPEPGADVKPPAEVLSSNSKVKVEPVKIFVVVSLVCCKERDTWEPALIIGAARFYPLVYVVASHPLARIDSTVTVVRPQVCLPSGGMCHEEVPGQVGTVLVTDRNITSSLVNGMNGEAGPFWDVMFDYLKFGVKEGTFRVVRRDRPNERSSPPGAQWVKQNQNDPGLKFGPAEPMVDGRFRGITKKPFQGDFDNLHMAPRMVAKMDEVKDFAKGWGFDNIVMAPFCLHDCLHMHWRWGAGLPTPIKFDHVKGWDDTDPYKVTNGTLVPRHQDVNLTIILGGRGFKVNTQSFPPKRLVGDLDVHVHNGCAYGVSSGAFAAGARAIEVEPFILKGIFALVPWPQFYWHLRFTGFSENMQGRKPVHVERLEFHDLPKLIDL